MVEDRYALQMQDITVEFPGVLANDHVSIDCKKGEVLGLLGENGAGKTTLMNVLYGLYPPTTEDGSLDYDIYKDMEAKGWPVYTIRRGEILVEDGKFYGKDHTGKFLNSG